MSRTTLAPALRWRLTLLIALLAGLLLLGWAWHQERWQAWLRGGEALLWLRAQAAALGPLAVWLMMSAALCLALPLVLLSMLVIAAFGPTWGMALCFAGAGLAALVSHRIGHLLGHELLLRLAGPRVRLLSETLGRRGLLAVVLMRLTPIAPFAVVNMVAGATHIRPWQMLLGTWIGMAPSTVVMGLLLDPLLRLLGRLDLPVVAGLAGLAAAGAMLLAWRLRRWRRSRAQS
ncbi:VTT domain-containing protein [Mitsuaria sp. WAJ17]|uniref:TVP38/TMEM64 family protein n=1 Tax=Mitsuaria sp. WAJ17 TaxID=2761452 RepID=UPI0016039630|nr:VTT domain-containing protein [Mitsuaria sp. WAJ17]MBB2484497.1 VTT domain-containing protein [Mitsuaria sp. WAJ17]